MTKKKYINNPFSIALFKALESIINKKQPQLNNTEKYILKVYKTHRNLDSVFKQINSIRIFIRRFPCKKFYLQNGISELDYIQYHTESLMHKIHTILEIMKLITNEIFCLEIPKEECNWNNLISKLDKNIHCMQIIDMYYKIFKKYIEYRHHNTHRGIYNDSEKETIEINYGLDLYHLNLNYDLDENFNVNFFKIRTDYEIKKIKKKRIKFINDTERIINNLIKEFFISLNDEFKNRTIDL